MKKMPTSPSFQVKNKIGDDYDIKIASFKKNIRKTTPHRHNNYFEIIYLSKGKGFHTIDSQKYAVTPPVVFVVKKEQIHYWELDDAPEGFVLILKKSFVDNSLDKDLKSLLIALSAFSYVLLHDKGIISQLFEMLVKEYRPSLSNNSSVMEGLLKTLLAKILELAKPVKYVRKKQSDLFHNFLEMLSNDKSLQNNVSNYARMLNTTAQNLNASCRKSAGQSAAEVLAQFIINEAKRLLLYTDKSVSEISLVLDFKDNSHFIKYFKRHTGHTPGSFKSRF